MSHPLDGMRVLDLTRLLPGAVCTMLLVDLGADVIKIEDPDQGDYARWLSPKIDDSSVFFRMNNRGKRSLILNLKATLGKDVLKRLAAGSDVLVESFRPGVMARLGVDYDTLRTVNPHLIYCALSGWGTDGPRSQAANHDLNYVSTVGIPGAMATPQVLGAQVADIGGAYAAVAGILAALLRRERSGKGAFVDTSLAESALPFALYPWVEALMQQGTSGGDGVLTGGQACYRIYGVRDGQSVALAALESKFWTNFCNAIGRPDLIEGYLQPARQPELIQTLDDLFVQKTAAEWAALLEPADCCFTVVKAPAEVANDPQFQARGMLGTFDDGTPWMRSPLRLSESEVNVENRIPGYGDHTRAVLAEYGYTESEIDVLAAARAVGKL